MMRSPRSLAVVCRRPSGEIVVRDQPWHPVWAGVRPLRWPFLRGAVVLLESVVNGLQALTFAASQQAPHAEDGAGEAGEPGRATMALSIAVAVALALGIFVATPHFLTGLLGFRVTQARFHLVDGAFRAALLLGYLALLARLPDVRRLFAYHGAEHKAIYTYERGRALTVENAREMSRFHPRCGTSFLLIVLLVSIAVFAAVLRVELSPHRLLNLVLTLGLKLLLLFPVAGVSYELIRLSGRHDKNPLVKILVAPGLWLQRLTTREPDDGQLEIALVAVRKALAREMALGPVAAPVRAAAAVQVFPSYGAVDLPA